MKRNSDRRTRKMAEMVVKKDKTDYYIELENSYTSLVQAMKAIKCRITTQNIQYVKDKKNEKYSNVLKNINNIIDKCHEILESYEDGIYLGYCCSMYSITIVNENGHHYISFYPSKKEFANTVYIDL